MEVIELFNLHYPERGSIYYSPDGENYLPLNAEVDESELNVLKYIGDSYGALWRNYSSPRFPDKSYTVSVFSNEEDFRYEADSAEVIADVLPEITDLTDEGGDTVINDAMTMALIDLERWV
ncbi:MAG: hypothetical protein ABEJ56_00945 [Candidatus Nanohaloarchaea archaeon]